MAQDYYAILGVSQDATTQELKRAFRQIARECHPDVSGGSPEAAERFKSARKAYETLMDPITRARYDRRGQRRAHSGGSFFDSFWQRTGEAAGREPRPRRGRGRPFDPGNDLDLDDLVSGFGDFGFGDAPQGKSPRPGTRSSGPRESPRGPQRGDDVQIDLEVPASTATQGGSVTAVYYRLQRADSWRPGTADAGLVRLQDIANVRMIPGTRDGEILRERGLGDAGAHGGPFGDLVIRVRVKPDPPRTKQPESKPEDSDVSSSAGEVDEITVEIGVVEALLGGRAELDTPQGKIRLTIPPGTSGGTRMRLRRKGRRGADGEPADLYVTLRIKVPAQLDAESRRLIEAFAKLNPGS